MSETPIYLDRDIVSYHCGKDVAPRVTVISGSLATVATHDARSGKFKWPKT